jgi:hypothetical protein
MEQEHQAAGLRATALAPRDKNTIYLEPQLQEMPHKKPAFMSQEKVIHVSSSREKARRVAGRSY